jgi:DNA polymerase-1
VFHNAKFDLQKLILAGVVERDRLSPERVIDTECLAQLLDEHRQKKLKVLARDLLGESTNEAAVIAKAKRKLKLTKLDGFDKIPRNVLIPYALKDADFTLRLFRHLYPQVLKDEQLARLFSTEMELLLVMLDVEAAGLKIDLDYLHRTTKEVRTELLRHESAISKATGLKVWYPEKSGQATPEGAINVNSHQQILDALKARKIRVADTKNETLVGLDDDLPKAILALRGDKKLLDYLLAIERERRGDIIHPNFKLFEPKTGRMSSGKVDE